MAQVITFEEYVPPARFDGIPWTQARVQEAADPTGAWTTIETIELDPVDTEPENPQERSLSTANADDAVGLWYRLVFLDADGATAAPTTPVRNAPPAPDRLDLCTLADVTDYVPGYLGDPQTDLKLQSLLTAQSMLIMGPSPGGCGREIIARTASVEARDFVVDSDAARAGRIEIGDLSAIDGSTVIELVASPGGAAIEVDTDTVVALYGPYRQPTRSWEPVTSLLFPDALTEGQIVRVTGTWGFPEVPSFIREACAARVILRYVNDVAAAGTDFAAALASIDTAALFRNSEDALKALREDVIA